MQVLFESRDPAGAPLRELVERRVSFTMRRLSWRVPRARVLLSDVNGPRGGVDKRCQLELTTVAAGRVVISSVRRDWRSAIDDALARAVRVLMRLTQRAHGRSRSPGRAVVPSLDA